MINATFTSNMITGILIDNVVYIVKSHHSSGGSAYRLRIKGESGWTFQCCLESCCNNGFKFQPDIIAVVEQAKTAGATMAVSRNSHVEEIAGLPVEDVENHIGEIGNVKILRDR